VKFSVLQPTRCTNCTDGTLAAMYVEILRHLWERPLESFALCQTHLDVLPWALYSRKRLQVRTSAILQPTR
jgi:hypothetical protein